MRIENSQERARGDATEQAQCRKENYVLIAVPKLGTRRADY
jgi:hypothetical protein